MRVRIISGRFGGRTLDVPPGKGTHPMGERIRNALFNSIQGEIVGADVLDAFAGTGALGLESLSRGAKSATFIESGRIAQKVIDNNINNLDLTNDEARLIRSRVNSWISNNSDLKFDIIFADPPYFSFEKHFSTIEKLLSLLKPGALMVLSKPGKCEEVIINDESVVVDDRSYSQATLTYYRRKA